MAFGAFQPNAFQNNAFQVATIAPVVHQPGGGYYHRPVIYLDEDGKPVDLAERRRLREEARLRQIAEDQRLLEFTPGIMEALSAAMPGANTADLLAMIEQAERRLAWSQFDAELATSQSAQDEEALVLLLASTF